MVRSYACHMDGPGSILRYSKATFPCAIDCRNADLQLLSKTPIEKFRTADKNQDCGYADMRSRSNIYVKCCGVEVAEG
jgi:hypothetical protein